MKKNHNEYVSEFTKKFNKLYNNIPTKIKPSHATTKVIFVGAFKPEFGFTLRERKLHALD